MVDDEEFADFAAEEDDDNAVPPPVDEVVQQQKSQQEEDVSLKICDAGAVIPSQAVPVVGVPNYPNCIKWSEENLLSIGAGHLVTILDPASMGGPRGFIPVATSPLFDFGRVQHEDLKAHSLFEICLARDPRPGVRSIDWSPPGLAQNGGSLLAVCTTDSRVKVYRTPFCEFQSEWVEIIDLSEMLFNHCLNNDFKEAEPAAAQLAKEEETIPSPKKWGFRMKRKLDDDAEPQHRKVQKARHHTTGEIVGGDTVTLADPEMSLTPNVDQQKQARMVSDEKQAAILEKGSRVEVLEEDEDVQYWVGGWVAEIVNGEALVKLDRPQYGAMEEWVPVHGTNEADNEEAEEPSHRNSSSQRDGKQVMQTWRPRIRPQIDMETLERSLIDQAGGERLLVNGELVEAWINDRWQEGTVLTVQGSGVLVNFSASSRNARIEPNNLRLAPVWNGKRWIWKPISSNQKASVTRHHGNDICVSTPVEPIGHDCPNDSNERQLVGQPEGQIQSLGANDSGQMQTTLALYKEKDILSSPTQSGSGQESPRATTQEPKEKSYPKVYKRRGLATTVPPAESLGTTRPTRTKRLPLKLRSEDTITWIKDADGSMLSERDLALENVPNDKDGDYVQKVKGVKDRKTKQARLTEDNAKVNEAKSATDTNTLKEAEGDKAGEKAKHDNNDSGMKIKYISPHAYAARSEFLSPLSVAWSSQYQDQVSSDGNGGLKPQKMALVGAGMKSGRVCLWRMAYPSLYTIDHSQEPVAATFLGFLFAHESWVTNLSWASCCNFDLGKLNARDSPEGDGALGDTLLLATGCADGSVKLWAGLSRELTGSDCVPFRLLKEVVEADFSPVTALALFAPPPSGDLALLAVGKGSGSVGVWELKSSGIFRQICSQPRAHHQMVTGFSWTSDGRCLYSCGQDSLKRWDVSQQKLLPLPFPDGSSLFPPNTGSDICSLETLESVFGVTLSPNGLALAAVRGIASDLLDQMYQARSQKGMVQVFWLGSKHVDVKDANPASLANVAPARKAMSGYDRACWELNVVDALKALEDPRKTLVLWDVVAALSSLKERLGTEGVVSILSKWLSTWAPEQGAVGAVDSHEWSTGSFQKAISEASCRRLHLLNVLYRRLLLSHDKIDLLRAHSSEQSSKGEAEVWRDCLYLVELELRQRLVHLSLQIATFEGNNSMDPTHGRNSLWIKLLVEWVLSNVHSVDPRLGKLAASLQPVKGNTRLNLGASSPMEACTFCDSRVALESPEIATCTGPGKHRLERCSVSMQVCPPVPLWRCSCCGRSATKQASSLFFSVSSREQIAGLSLPVFSHTDSVPFCPFCGILMHRLLPNFLLTPSLVSCTI
ncbi:unnamed protein product [Calypogeia fissa]